MERNATSTDILACTQEFGRCGIGACSSRGDYYIICMGVINLLDKIYEAEQSDPHYGHLPGYYEEREASNWLKKG